MIRDNKVISGFEKYRPFLLRTGLSMYKFNYLSYTGHANSLFIVATYNSHFIAAQREIMDMIKYTLL